MFSHHSCAPRPECGHTLLPGVGPDLHMLGSSPSNPTPCRNSLLTCLCLWQPTLDSPPQPLDMGQHPPWVSTSHSGPGHHNIPTYPHTAPMAFSLPQCHLKVLGLNCEERGQGKGTGRRMVDLGFLNGGLGSFQWWWACTYGQAIEESMYENLISPGHLCSDSRSGTPPGKLRCFSVWFWC